ncbi:MAG: NYN domain-containing protein [Clostridiales bacterium]|nr:NYN domain-containing protein [Clostridiales bacterium]
MDSLQKIALLIDADNTQLGKLEGVIREISTHGRIVVKRAYGNWKKDILKNWEKEIKRLAINANQQFDYVTGKNATDMALVIDAMDMLYKDIYDAFVIVASDSDYTPLAIRIHESGVYVIGVGEKKTPVAFRNACDEFIFLENIDSGKRGVKKGGFSLFRRSSDSPEQTKTEEDTAAASDTGAETISDLPDEDIESTVVYDIETVHNLLKYAYDTYQDEEGYCNVASAGTYIKRAMPEFDSRTYGFSKLPELIESFPDRYEMTRYKGKGTVTIVAYRCLD